MKQRASAASPHTRQKFLVGVRGSNPRRCSTTFVAEPFGGATLRPLTLTALPPLYVLWLGAGFLIPSESSQSTLSWLHHHPPLSLQTDRKRSIGGFISNTPSSRQDIHDRAIHNLQPLSISLKKPVFRQLTHTLSGRATKELELFPADGQAPTLIISPMS